MRKDFYHEAFRRALEKDGWTITHDPFKIRVGRIGYEVDFGAEKLIAAERGNEKIAVELKSFEGASDINEFHRAMGQFNDYEANLVEIDQSASFTWLFLKKSGLIFFRNLPFKELSKETG